MAEYLILVGASANRVYTQDAPRLMAAELQAFAAVIAPGGITVPSPLTLAGVPYLGFEADELGADGINALANLSGFFALFRRHGQLLEPIPAVRLDRFPDDLVTIPKYQGKTNEQLTKLLLNVTAMATAWPERLFSRQLRVLDPLCGRGSTLNQAALYGLDATGVELDQRDFEAYRAFIVTWLRTHRYKHQANAGALRIDGRALGQQFEVDFAADKNDYKAGQTQRIRFLNTDTTQIDRLIPKASIDIIVTDTPYGVRHGSHGDRLVRSPLALIQEALPGWVRTLRMGGALGMAYNRHVAAPRELAELLEAAGLQVVSDLGSDSYRHRVDASIDRDLIIARKG